MADRGQPRLAALAAMALLSGCDPVYDIEGAFFPSWMVCLVVGIFGAVGLRLVFVRTGIEPYLGPLPLIYTCLTLLVAMTVWVLFFPV